MRSGNIRIVLLMKEICLTRFLLKALTKQMLNVQNSFKSVSQRTGDTVYLEKCFFGLQDLNYENVFAEN